MAAVVMMIIVMMVATMTIATTVVWIPDYPWLCAECRHAPKN